MYERTQQLIIMAEISPLPLPQLRLTSQTSENIFSDTAIILNFLFIEKFDSFLDLILNFERSSLHCPTLYWCSLILPSYSAVSPYPDYYPITPYMAGREGSSYCNY